MPKEEFNPRTFFALHDLNGDGVLDQEEVESLLSTEIKKLYDPNNPEDDPNEMQEEYHRMREHIYKEADKDHDGLISRKEFLDLTARPEFEKDDGWKTLDEQQVYSQDELREYEKHRQEALAHQYAYYVPQQPQYYHPNQFVPYDHVAVPHPQQPGQVAYVPVQQHPGFQQHPQAGMPMQQQHPQAGMPMQQHPGAGVPIQHQQQPSHVQYQQPQQVPQLNQQQPPQQHYGQPQVAGQPQLTGQQPSISGQPIYTAHVGQQQHPNQPPPPPPAGHAQQPPPVGYQQPQMNAVPNAQYAAGQPNVQPNAQPNVQYQQPASQQQPSPPKH